MRVKAIVSFTMEYDINEECYPDDCLKIEDYIAVDKAAIKEDYTFVLESMKTKMGIKFEEVHV